LHRPRKRFGQHFLNPIFTTIEKKYLKQRVVLSRESATAAMRTLKRELSNNGAVSITARAIAANPIMVPFMNSHILMATGAADLAYSTGAALIPVFSVRDSDGHFHVFLETPLQIDTTARRREASDNAAYQFSAKLEEYVLKYPTNWLGWFEI